MATTTVVEKKETEEKKEASKRGRKPIPKHFFRIVPRLNEDTWELHVMAPCGHEAIQQKSTFIDTYCCPEHKKEGVLRFLKKKDQFVFIPNWFEKHIYDKKKIKEMKEVTEVSP